MVRKGELIDESWERLSSALKFFLVEINFDKYNHKVEPSEYNYKFEEERKEFVSELRDLVEVTKKDEVCVSQIKDSMLEEIKSVDDIFKLLHDIKQLENRLDVSLQRFSGNPDMANSSDHEISHSKWLKHSIMDDFKFIHEELNKVDKLINYFVYEYEDKNSLIKHLTHFVSKTNRQVNLLEQQWNFLIKIF